MDHVSLAKVGPSVLVGEVGVDKTSLVMEWWATVLLEFIFLQFYIECFQRIKFDL